MDPRRLDSTRIQNILNCEPPPSIQEEQIETKPTIEPISIPKPEPKANDENQQNKFEDLMGRLLKDRQLGKLNPETQETLKSIIPGLSDKCSIYMDINIYVVEEPEIEKVRPEPKAPPSEPIKPVPIIPKPQMIPRPTEPIQEFKSTKIFIPSFNSELKERKFETHEPVAKVNKVIPEPPKRINDYPDLFKRTFNEDAESNDKSLNNLLQKIKFYWRGTNQSYPYTFKKRYYSYYTETGEFCYTEAIDHSKKVIPNQSEPPSDFYFV